MFNIRMGVPEMKQFWDNLEQKIKAKSASKKDLSKVKRAKRIRKNGYSKNKIL